MGSAAAAAMVFACASAAHAEAAVPPPSHAKPDPSAIHCDASSARMTGIGSREDCRTIAAELQDLKDVTVEFSDRYQAVTVGVQIYTHSWVTHVDFVLPDGRLLGATPFGVRIRPWTPAIHSVRYTFHADAQKVLGFALSQVGKPYDFVGLSGYVFRIGFLHQPQSWFCSSLVAAAALQDGVDLSGVSPNFTSPARIKDSPLLAKVTDRPTYLVAGSDEPAQTAARAAGG
jgi:hypothetical protein